MYTWMTSKWLERQHNIAPMRKKLMQLVDLDEPTPFLDHAYLGCTQRECKPNETVTDEYRKCSSHEFLLPQVKNYQDGRNFTQKLLRGHTTWKDIRKSALSLLGDHPFLVEELESVAELSGVYSQIVLKCLYLTRIGRLDILWSVNKLARAVTKWTSACDLTSYIHHTNDYRQCCHVGNTAQHCRLSRFQDSDFCERL